MAELPPLVTTLRNLRAGIGHVTGACAGLAAFFITALLLGLVIGRAFHLNIVWVPEATRIVLIWGVALGAVSASCGREHFKLEMFGTGDESRPTVLDLVRTTVALILFTYVMVGGFPTIASTAMQAFASLPVSYSVMRTAVVAGIGMMAFVELCILVEQCLFLTQRHSTRSRRS